MNQTATNFLFLQMHFWIKMRLSEKKARKRYEVISVQKTDGATGGLIFL